MLAAEVTHIVQAPNEIIYILVSILSGGLLTAAVSWYKFTKHGEAQKQEIVTEAAEHAVKAMQGVLIRLERELTQAKTERSNLEIRLEDSVVKREALEREVRKLNERILELEAQIATYKTILKVKPDAIAPAS